MYLHLRFTRQFLSSLCVLGALLLATSASAAPPLKTPWMCEQTFPVSQSHDTGSHLGKGAEAWDFALPVGTPIVAPAAGTVRKLRQDSTIYGCDPKYAYDANYIIIEFGDGTEGLFLHLKANSSELSVGDKVGVGDPLGEIGMSGFTCGPHLHFQVQETCDSWWCSSVPATFVEHGDPTTGQELTSANCVETDKSPLDKSPMDDLPVDNNDAAITVATKTSETSKDSFKSEANKPASSEQSSRAIGGNMAAENTAKEKDKAPASENKSKTQ